MGRMERRFVSAGGAAILGALLVCAASKARAAAPPKEGVEFFENKIRPVLLDRCYSCHDGSGAKAIKAGFRLDTRDALLKGGESGKPAVVPGDPGASPLIHAIKWS